MVDTGRVTEDILLGVAEAEATISLTLLFPGAVMDTLCGGKRDLLGVLGATCGAPSLVTGRLPFESAEAGRGGGGMELSELKKLDLRLPLVPAGDEGNCDKLSTVLCDNEGRAFSTADVAASASIVPSSNTGSGSVSRNPTLELALEDALEADRNASKSPSTSSL